MGQEHCARVENFQNLRVKDVVWVSTEDIVKVLTCITLKSIHQYKKLADGTICLINNSSLATLFSQEPTQPVALMPLVPTKLSTQT